MNKLSGCCWLIGFWALGCSAAHGSDVSRKEADDRDEEGSAAETSSSPLEALPFCTTNADCSSSDTYCKFREGSCSGRGVCAQRPAICTRIFAPVCGCDGRTYSNACMAATAGVSIVHEGECAPRTSCGGLGNVPCPEPLVCVDDPTDTCDPTHGGSDCGGICVHVPNPCAAILCPVGEYCVVKKGTATCEPKP